MPLESTSPLDPDPSPLRIGHLIASDFAGGPEKQILTLSQQLRDRGWRVIIGSFGENRPRVEILENAGAIGFETFRVETRSPFDPRSILQIREQLHSHRLDVLVSHGYKANILGRIATVGTATRPLATVRGFTAATTNIVVYEKLERLVLRTFPLVLGVSEGTLAILRQHGLSGPRYRVLHNAVDCSITPDPVDLRREYSLPDDAQVLVAAGRLSPEKGHGYLVEAMARVRETNERAHCIIFGEGALASRLQSKIEKLGLEDRVQLVGFRRDVLRCLAAADLVVNPSLTEGLPNVVLEAMSQATAVVATEVGGVGELIVDGQSGWLVEPARPDRLAKAIGRALADDELRKTTGRESRRTAAERFSFEYQATRFQEYCRMLCSH